MKKLMFATMFVALFVSSIWSMEVTSIYTTTITLDRVTAAADSVDSVTVGPFQYDMGFMGVWIKADSIPTGGALLIDSLRFYWKILGKGNIWRPLFIDSSSVDGVLTGYVTTGGAKASTAGITMTNGVDKYAVFYDPNNPMPIPLLGEAEYLMLKVSRTNHAPVWVNRYTFYLRLEKDIAP